MDATYSNSKQRLFTQYNVLQKYIFSTKKTSSFVNICNASQQYCKNSKNRYHNIQSESKTF